MALSLNRWLAIPNWADPRLRTITIPGTGKSIRCRRVAAPLFAAFYADWHAEMPQRLKLTARQLIACYNYRAANGGGGLSNHSSGTAVDACWNTVLLADNARHMTDEERRILKRILHRYRLADGHHVLANGYAWRSVDEMHTELSQGWDSANGATRYTTRADVEAIKRKLGIRRNGVRTLRADGTPRRRKVAA